MITICEDLSNTDLSDEDGEKYITFCNEIAAEEYPELQIEVVNEQSICKIQSDEYIGTELLEDIEASAAQMWEKWERLN